MNRFFWVAEPVLHGIVSARVSNGNIQSRVPMRFRRLAGGRLPDVSVVALGTMSVASGVMHASVDEQQAIRTIHAALDAGTNFIDTAPAYGDGESESRLGRALAEVPAKRGTLVIATKASGPTLGAAEIVADCEASLRRLRIDCIDLYQLHWPRGVVPMRETFDALQALRRQGKIREIGVCNFGPATLREAWDAGAEPVTNQVAYSLLTRGVEFELAPRCASRGVGILCYSPLAQGLLGGKYTSPNQMPPERCRSRHFAGTRPMSRHGEAGCELELFTAVEEVRAVARDVGCSMHELAIAWLAHQPTVTGVLCGASTPEQAIANAHAAGIELDEATLTWLNAATDRVKHHLGANLDVWQGGANSRIR
jgi:aryl-alcohol dehydrogenase-like predicted oxidoreductase